MRHWRRVLLVGGGLLVVAVSCSEPEQAAEEQRARGAALYDMHCVACHGGATGGSISDIPPPHNAEGHTWHHPDCDLIDFTLDGLPPREGYPVMPGFGNQLTAEEVEAILAHIKTWWEPEQRAAQATATEQLCD